VRRGIVGEGFEVVDFGGGDIDEAGLIAIDIETGNGADDLAALVANGKAVAQDGGVSGAGGEREGGHERENRGADGELS
jgi:hypothetical protein